jgi:UDP-N-acetylmuramate--alanine ligase
VIASEERVHFIGIGGVGMSAIAKVMLERGVPVSGSDLKRSRVASTLEAMGARIHIGHDPSLVEGCATVVVSSAIPRSNAELVAAGRLGLRTITRGEALAALLDEVPSIVVAGTHGKTTTTSMVVSIMHRAGRDPTYLVGGGLNEAGTNARSGADELVVAESDESDGSFLLLRPSVAVVTNVEADHLDHWGSLEAIRAAFRRWVSGVRLDGAVVLPAAERELVAHAREAGRTVVVFGEEGDVWAEEVELRADGVAFVLAGRYGRAPVALRQPGRHNLMNALAAATACFQVGVQVALAAQGLSEYRGVERRFQLRGTAAGVTVIDDYSHHPTEVRAVLAAARPGSWRSVVALFQPHLYSRTAALAPDFGGAFSDADRIVVTDVYGAREQPVPGVTGKLVTDAVCACLPGRPVAYLPHRDELLAYLQHFLRAGDLLLTIGAGDVTTVGEELLERLGAAS